MIRAVIVDDEEPARARRRRLLEGTGVAVVGEAGDGDSAVEEIDALTPDVVFLDIQMPVASGLDVAARLRAPKPRIVFCTAFDRFAIEAFEQHALDYLLKPVNRARLAQTVGRIARDVVEQQRRSRELAEAARTQARLMPPAQAIHGLDVAGICIPAEGVGGDYYDVLPTGTMVGWSGEAAFTERTEPFRPGDVLAMFSDGLTETTDADGVAFGVEGVSRAVERHAMLNAEEMPRAVLDDVRDFGAGPPAHDDRTIVVVKR